MSVRPKWLSALLENEIVRRVRDDPRTLPGTSLGWPKKTVLPEVLEWGQANFDAPIGHLTGDDRALLYARHNQERHLDELVAAFKRLFDAAPSTRRCTVIDLGCGPFTAGLAFAAALGGDREFRYYGIDKYQSMRTLGTHLAATARELGGLHAETTHWFGETLGAADFGGIRWDLTVVVASYLLASQTLDVPELVEQLQVAIGKIGPGPAAVLYTNSATEYANKKFPVFRARLHAAGFELKQDAVELFTETHKDQKQLRYALFFRQERTTIDLGTPKT